MSLYSSFATQQELVEALAQREAAESHAAQVGIARRATTEPITVVVSDLLSYYMDYARENPQLYRLVWVRTEQSGVSEQVRAARQRATVEVVAGLLQLGIEQGAFAARDPLTAAVTILGMVNAPFMLFYTGQLRDPALRDAVATEALSAALIYLVSPSGAGSGAGRANAAQ